MPCRSPESDAPCSQVRGKDQGKIYRAALSVLDRLELRLNAVDKDSVAGLERLTFFVTTRKSRADDFICEGTRVR